MLVEPIVWSADAPDRLRESFTQQLDTALRERTTVVHAPRECGDDTCLAEAAAREAARGRLRVEIDERERDYEILLVWLGPDGREHGDTTVRCDVCTPIEAADTAARAALELAGSAGRGALHVTSAPAGAEVWVDGRRAGLTPFAGELTAGRHRVEVRKPGHRAELRTVEIDAGGDERLRVDLAAERMPRARALRIAGEAAMGVGLAVLLTGVVLTAVDESPVRSNCDGVHRDRFGNCEFRWNTLAGGVTSIVLGAAITATGAVLYAKNRPKTRTELRASATRVTLMVRF